MAVILCRSEQEIAPSTFENSHLLKKDVIDHWRHFFLWRREEVEAWSANFIMLLIISSSPELVSSYFD